MYNLAVIHCLEAIFITCLFLSYFCAGICCIIKQIPWHFFLYKVLVLFLGLVSTTAELQPWTELWLSQLGPNTEKRAGLGQLVPVTEEDVARIPPPAVTNRSPGGDMRSSKKGAWTDSLATTRPRNSSQPAQPLPMDSSTCSWGACRLGFWDLRKCIHEFQASGIGQRGSVPCVGHLPSVWDDLQK